MRRMFRTGSEGFTFVDAVVAVLLSALAAGAVVPLFAVFIRRWPEYQVRRRDAVSLMNLEADLRRELGLAEVPYWSGGPGRPGLSGASGPAESSGQGGGPGRPGESRLTGILGVTEKPEGPGTSGAAGGLGMPGGAGLPGEREGTGGAGALGSAGIIEEFEGGLAWGEGESRVRVLRGDGAVSVSSSGVTRRYRFTDAPGVSVLLSEGGGMIGVRITAAWGAEADVLFGERRLESGEEPGL